MSMYWAKPGIGDVGSYQMAGVPFTHSATASFTVDFEFVTKAVVVTCTDDNASNTIDFGPGTSAVHVPKGSTRFEVRCNQINVVRAAGTISVVAELTGIEARNIAEIDLSNYGTVS